MRQLIIGFFIIIFFLPASVFAAGSPENQREDIPALTIGILPDVDSVPFEIAQQKGYFRDEDVAVHIKYFKSPVDRDTAFQTGDVDAVISDMLAAAFAENNGFHVVISSMTNGSYKLLAAPGSGAVSIRDLKDGRIGISKNTIIEYATDRMLAAGGMSSGDIKKVVVPQIPVRLEMLERGKLGGATLAEPLSTSAVTAGCRVVDSTDRLGINPGIFLVNKKVFDAKPEALRRMYRAYNRAVHYINTAGRLEYIDGLIKAMGFPEQAKDVMVFPEYTDARPPAPSEFSSVIEWLLERGLIDQRIQYNQIVDSSLLPG